jgi:hypothetical protein
MLKIMGDLSADLGVLEFIDFLACRPHRILYLRAFVCVPVLCVDE